MLPSAKSQRSHKVVATMTTANKQQQVATLLQSILARGVDVKDAVPTVKMLVEAKIFSLDELTPSNVPSSMNSKIRKKLLPTNKKASPNKRRKTNPIVVPPITSTPSSVLINRSPVLTLWTTIVSQRLFSVELHEAVTIGNAVSANIARAKGKSLGIYANDKDTSNKSEEKSSEAAASQKEEERHEYYIMGMEVSAVRTPEGIRALDQNENPLDPHKTWNLLERKFGDSFGYVYDKMKEAAAMPPTLDDLSVSAYNYYVHIRPDIPHGTKGWGAHGSLDMAKLSDFFQPTTKVGSSEKEGAS